MTAGIIQCVRTLIRTPAYGSRPHVIRMDEREIRVGHFPIGIDADAFIASAAPT